jgi:tetratricopeptide (TPR) repeat protein
MIGRQLGHYTVVEHIGSGAMGVVYRARDDTLDRDVALKILPGGTLDPAARGRLKKEARALSRAAHPSIATVYDFGTEGDLDFIVMELVPGETLSQRLAAGPLSDATVLDLGQQLALGLGAAHAAGVIHRDVKPSNLKVTPDGRLKILDFGVALQSVSDTETTRTASGAGRMAGTLPYMAPEQLRGAEADVRSDVYGAGAVLYEMATGTRAFPERQEGPLFDAVLRRPVVPPRTIRPSLSPQIETCILKALEKDPDLRYQSARDLGRDLGAATALIHAVPREPAAPRWRIRPIPIAAALLIVALGGFAMRPYLGRLGAARWESAASSRTPPAAAAPVPAALLLAVVPPQNLTSRPAVDAWLPLVQSLFTAELTGVRDLGVIDPLTLNLRVTARGGQNAPQQRLDEALDDLGVGLTIDSRILPAGAGFQLQSNLVDRRSSEVRFTNRADLSGESDLPRAVKAATQAIVSYFDLRVLKLADTREMRPWIELREHNIEAVKAFVQANQYMYRYQLAEVEPLLRRAIELDPSFVAPRLWLIGTAESADPDTQKLYDELKQLAPSASPFDQAMIGFAGAMMANDLPGQIRYLQIALEYSPGNNILLVNLANARAASGDCDGALRDLEPAVRVRWEFPPLYTLAGACALTTGRLDDARRLLDAGAALSAVDPFILGLRAGLEAATGAGSSATKLTERYAAAQRQLGRPVEDPNLADIYDTLGKGCAARGEKARADVLFSMRDRLTPK